MSNLFAIARPILFALEAEQAHAVTIKLLKAMNYWPAGNRVDDPCLRVQAFGLTFPNPIGVAAGLDKHAEVPDALLRLGFGFTEIGTVTPLPQPGNPLPRLFRLVEDEGVINRLGFNSQGHHAVYKRLARRLGKSGIVGVNIGANKDAADRIDDYAAGIRAFADVASYFTINISSPNTPGLRDLQRAGELDELLQRALETRDQASSRKPLLLKIAPDLTPAELDDIVRIARDRNIDGMIVGNTTTSRPAKLRSDQRNEAGGLSGKPLFELATRMLAQTWIRVEKQFPIVGAGGIHDAASAIAKIEAGASLLQIYSALVFNGPALADEIRRALTDRIKAAGVEHISQITGIRAETFSVEAKSG